MQTMLEELMLELDLRKVMRELNKLSTHIRDTIPDEILFDASGQPNLRNRYGAILVHVSSLTSILKTFLEN